MSFCYSSEVDDAELCKVDELRERLIFKILMGIDNELTLLFNILTRFNNVNQVNKIFISTFISYLFVIHITLINSSSLIDYKELKVVHYHLYKKINFPRNCYIISHIKICRDNYVKVKN